ncbi:MAG TPA: hypothetical protein VFB25_02070 [Gaiellaceae bacterium]|nr:hypothetical protein [Gaiellaceae bacterium]
MISGTLGDPKATIDDLVDVARAAGLPGATRRTIRSWRSKGELSRPSRVGRLWLYPHETIYEVMARVRWRAEQPALRRFMRFIEGGIVPPADGLDLALNFLELYAEGLALERSRLEDPDELAAEIHRTARQRTNSPLPHRVRGVSFEQRELALTFLLAKTLGMPLDSPEEIDGQLQLERLTGLRSGRGGRERDVSDLLPRQWSYDPRDLARRLRGLSDERIELARRSTELLFVWMPAVIPTFASIAGASYAPMMDIFREWSRVYTPSVCLLMFSVFAATTRDNMTDREVSEALTWSTAASTCRFLIDRPAHEQRVAIEGLDKNRGAELERVLASFEDQ